MTFAGTFQQDAKSVPVPNTRRELCRDTARKQRVIHVQLPHNRRNTRKERVSHRGNLASTVDRVYLAPIVDLYYCVHSSIIVQNNALSCGFTLWEGCVFL